MKTLEKNIAIIRERLIFYATENLYSGFSEATSFADHMKSAFSEDEISKIYDELDKNGEFDFLLKREYAFLERGKINEMYYLLEREHVNIIEEMEEVAPEYTDD